MDWLKRTVFGKKPEAPSPPTPSNRSLQAEAPRVEIDKSCQVLSLNVPDDVGREATEAPLRARPQLGPAGMMPAGLLAVKAKLFSDGLMAAVEVAADAGCGRLPGRRALLETWHQACPSEYLAAALHLRGSAHPASDLVARFLADPAESQPLSFYTWSPSLRAIFRSDRFLQAPLPAAEAAGLSAALQAEPYRAQLSLAARLTNPLTGPSLLKEGPDRALFPSSQAVETRFARALLGLAPIPAGFDLVAELVQALQAGKLSLRPPPDAGWYAHQQWPLEALVHDRDNREKARLTRQPRYQTALEEMFRALFALTRETHIKQLERISLGCAAPRREVIVDVRPEVRVEPLVTYYERMAAGFAFIQEVLRDALGPEGLATLHRQTPDGPVEPTLDRELEFMIELFQGCAQVACEDLGMSDSLGNSQTALKWLHGWADDPDLGQDVRCMVPLFYDLGRQKHKVLAVVGYSERPVDVSFATPPHVTVSDPDAKVRFGTTRHRLVYPVAVEVYVSRLLDRAEFRNLCDDHATLGSLRSALA